ncbi:TRAP transporter large permease [Porifericola rhodea]|uniref:TRAP transporter large permease n=1 Tax=Porifericola rhodea TaxID=930972 RepID=UPI002666EF46|nr:TRAP transporter large permease [Porifericola rhodea]WKN32334.1 TRAP transporter large permease [Porifericola rhodea]
MEAFEVLVLLISFIIFIAIGVPIAYCIGLAGVLTMLLSIDYLPAVTTFAQRMATGLDSFTLLAIPLFILAGQLMNTGGIATRLIEFAKVLVGRLPGGLAVVNILANMLFGAISGSAGASASAIGTIMHPRMKKEGYDENFSAAVNISSATTGLVIPPSNILIIYSLASGGVSIAALFLAGYIPGILTGFALIGFAAAYAYRKNYPTGEKVPLKEGIYKLLAALPSLLLLVIILGGIVAGVFTATEASGVAVLYCLALAFIYREISWKDLPGILIKTTLTTCIVLLMVAASIGLSWVMAYEEIPQNVSAALLQLSDSPILILLIINIILLFVGVFMDMTPAVLIFTPIFLPVVTQQLGLDPVHFGIILIMNLCVGLCTPPVGTVLFIGCSVANIKIQSVIKPLLPFFIAMIMVLLLVTYVPEISLWLPEMFGF